MRRGDGAALLGVHCLTGGLAPCEQTTRFCSMFPTFFSVEECGGQGLLKGCRCTWPVLDCSYS